MAFAKAMFAVTSIHTSTSSHSLVLLPFPTSVLIYGLSLNWTLVKTEMISITHE